MKILADGCGNGYGFWGEHFLSSFGTGSGIDICNTSLYYGSGRGDGMPRYKKEGIVREINDFCCYELILY